MGVIEPKDFTKDYYYGKQKLLINFWEGTQYAQDYGDINNEYIIRMMEQAEKIICIISSEKLPDQILKAIGRLQERNVRIYVLSNRLYKEYIDSIAGRVLIRYSDKISGFMMLIDPNTEFTPVGFIGSSNSLSSSESITKYIRLNNSKQINEAYRYFCWNFWQEAQYEARTKDEALKLTKAKEAPFDIYPLLDAQYLYYTSKNRDSLNEYLFDLIGKAKRRIVIIANRMYFNNILVELIIEKSKDGIDVELYTKLDEVNERCYAQLATNNSIKLFALEKIGSQIILIDSNQGVLISDSVFNKLENEILYFAIKMSGEDIRECQKICTAIRQQGTVYRYYAQRKLEDIEGNFILNGATDKKEDDLNKVKKFVECNLGDIRCNDLRSLKEGAYKIDYNNIQGYPKLVHYTYRLVPTYRNKDAKISSLYKAWQDEREKLERFIIQLEEAINTRKNENKTILDKLQSDLPKAEFVFLDQLYPTFEINKKLQC